MKARSKSSKKVTRKSVAKKAVTSSLKKKKTAAKSVKKRVAAKQTGKARTGKAATKSISKKKTPALKSAKKSSEVKKQVAEEIPVTLIEETIVTVTATMPGNGFPSSPPSGLLVGKVIHYYNHSSVAIIELDAGNLRVGDRIHIKGHTTDFEQVVESMEIDHQFIEMAEEGQTVGVKVRDMVREHDQVYKQNG